MVTIYPNQELYKPTRDIPKKDIKSETFSQIGSSMLEILRAKGGIGLSANQVGLPLNMCVIELGVDPKIMLNPRIIKMSNEKEASREACLSIPGTSVVVQRHKTVTVAYESVTGETEEIDADGLLSYCLQHEIDHLKGVLMINRISAYHKEKAIKQVNKFKRASNGRRI